MFKLAAALLLAGLIAGAVVYAYFANTLPELDRLDNYQPALATRIFNNEGKLLAEYADEHRILVPFDRIPPRLVHAFLAAEDQQFYEHPGINPARILSAALANLRAGHTVQGGSTITQQVAKNFLLTPERSLSRKIREAILAYRIEQRFSKNEILYLYLNQIYLGRGAYGVASAAWRYFHKTLDELTLAECAMLAGLPKAPSKYAPHRNPRLAVKRRNTVLHLMAKSHYADPEQIKRALAEPLHVAPLDPPLLQDAYADAVHRRLAALFGEQTLRRQGLTVIVPYDPAAESAAIHAVRHGLLRLEQEQYYRYPPHHEPNEWPRLLHQWQRQRKHAHIGDDELVPALVEQVRGDTLLVNDGLRRWRIPKPHWQWERSKPRPPRPRTWIAGDEIMLQGDGKGGVILTQRPSIQSALYSIDLERGTVLARVGGFDFQPGGFDRVGQAKRQPGSAFKPFLYVTALENGMTPASIVMDTPVVFGGKSFDDFWRPDNYKNQFAGPVTLRDALEHSRNLASIKLLQDLGIDRFRAALENYPFGRTFPKQLSLALGSAEVSLEALTESYAVLATGKRWKPVLISQVQDRNGHTLHRAVAGTRCQTCHMDSVGAASDTMRPAIQVLDPPHAYLITNMMKGVIERGTGRRALALHRPAAGKTGTTNKQVDAWFMGYTPQVLTGVWTGRDTPRSMGRRQTGAHAALPIWLEAMQAFHRNRPVKEFPIPEGVEIVTIDRKTGKMADANTQDRLDEAFIEGTAPSAPAQQMPETPQDDETRFFELGL